MPEGDTILRSAHTLQRALGGKQIVAFETVLPKLARVDVDSPLAGRVVEGVEAQGKWLLIRFSGDLILLTHMLMSGTWHIYRPGETWRRRRTHMRVLLSTSDFEAVAFNVPVAEFHTAESLLRRPHFRKLGPSLLRPDSDPQVMMANLRGQAEREIGAALLDQTLLSGIGNIYKSESCFGSGVNPFRRVDSLSIQELSRLVATAQKYLMANAREFSTDNIFTVDTMRQTTNRSGSEDRLWVYRRRGKPCHKCGTPIEARKQQPGARTTFWCPSCQPLDPLAAR